MILDVLRARGWTLDELGALPPESWIELYGAARAAYWEERVVDVATVHAAKPRETQRRFLRASNSAWGIGKRPFWTDPRKLKAWLQRGVRGVVTRSAGQAGAGAGAETTRESGTE